MAREFAYGILKTVTTILVLLTLASNFLFTRNGHVTRKTLRVTYVGALLSGISMFLLAWFSESSPSTSTKFSLVLCGFGSFVLFSVLWALKYFSLPYVENKINEIRENFNEKRTRQ